MKAEKLAGIFVALLLIIALSAVLNAGTSTPIWQWPIETFAGIAFTFGWLTRAPLWLAYLFASVVVIIIGLVGYFIGRWLWRITHR